MGWVFIVVILIIGAIAASMAYNNRELKDITQKLSNIVEIQDSIFGAVLTYSQEFTKDEKKNPKESAVKPQKSAPEVSSYKNAIRMLMKNNDINKSTMASNIETINGIIRYNNILLIMMVAFVLIQGFLLYFLLIRRTHRISGPIYVMSRYMDEVFEGKTPKIRPLRKNDELKEFYDMFTKLLERSSGKKE
jgi:hypothetical protein